MQACEGISRTRHATVKVTPNRSNTQLCQRVSGETLDIDACANLQAKNEEAVEEEAREEASL